MMRQSLSRHHEGLLCHVLAGTNCCDYTLRLSYVRLKRLRSFTRGSKEVQRAAIVGLGLWGQHILRQLRGSDVIRITHAVGHREAHRSIATEHGADFTMQFEDVLANQSIDLIILVTPHALHSAQIAAAARAYKHVFCEKPIGLTVAEVHRSLEACRTAGVRLGVGHERRFEPAMNEIRELVKKGSFGTIMHVEASFSHDRLRGLGSDNWRMDAPGEPPLAMTATGIHLTDLFIDLIGPIESVAALPANRVAFMKSADVLSLQLRFSCGATGYISMVLATPFYARLIIYGNEAWAEVRNATHPDQAGPSTLTFLPRAGTISASTLEWRDAVRANLEQFALSSRGVLPIRSPTNRWWAISRCWRRSRGRWPPAKLWRSRNWDEPGSQSRCCRASALRPVSPGHCSKGDAPVRRYLRLPDSE
jgi:predicted dehydrogenase